MALSFPRPAVDDDPGALVGGELGGASGDLGVRDVEIGPGDLADVGRLDVEEREVLPLEHRAERVRGDVRPVSAPGLDDGPVRPDPRRRCPGPTRGEAASRRRGRRARGRSPQPSGAHWRVVSPSRRGLTGGGRRDAVERSLAMLGVSFEGSGGSGMRQPWSASRPGACAGPGDIGAVRAARSRRPLPSAPRRRRSRTRYAWWISVDPLERVAPTEQYLVADSSIARRTASMSIARPSTTWTTSIRVNAFGWSSSCSPLARTS